MFGGEPKKQEQLQRSVFKWVQAADDQEKSEGTKKGKKHATITAQEVARYYGVPDETLRNYIRGEIQEEASCKSLPFTLTMFMSYTCVVMMHDPVIPVNDVEESITFDIEENANFAFSSPYMGHKGLYDINSATDFWSWMINGFAPLVFNQEKSFAEGREMDDPQIAAVAGPLPLKDRGLWLNYNRIVGGVRIRQERGSEQVCSSLGILQRFFKLQCLGGLDGSGYELDPEKLVARYTTNPKRTFWLWNTMNVSTMLDDMNQKEKDGWVDRGTKKIEISIPVYNGNLGVYTILYVDFFFSRGGHIWKRVLPMSTYSQWWKGWWNVLPDVLWSLGLCSILMTELGNVCATLLAKTGGGLRGVWHEYVNVWNIVDWATVFGGAAIISGYIFRFMRTGAINDELVKLGTMDAWSEEAAYRAQSEVFMDLLAEEVQSANNFRLLLGFYPSLIVMRLFEAFAHQPRLSIVTQTLGDAAVDLTHFLLVFMSIFLTYAIAGIVLFGREVDGFTNGLRAFNTCFRIMMGDFDWEEMLQVGRFFAGVWFLTFVVIINILMLNMLLAIVMDAYSEQKARLGEAETLWEELVQVFRRWRGERSGELRSLKEVSRAVRIIKDGEMAVKLTTTNSHHDEGINFDMSRTMTGMPSLGNEETSPITPKSIMSASFSFAASHLGHHEDFCLVTVDSLLDACPQMQEEQAMEMIQNAVNDYYLRSRGDTNIEEMCHIIRKVNFTTKRFKRHMIKSLQEMEKEQGIDLTKVLKDELTPGGANKSDKSGGGTEEEEDAVAHNDGKMAPADSEYNTGGISAGGRASTLVAACGASLGEAPRNDDEHTHYAGMLHMCRTELSHARHWIGEDELRDVDPNAARVPMEFCALTNLDDAVEFSVKRVLDDEVAVVRACRACGIGPENDVQRARALGKVVRVMQKDPRDGTVKCRVPDEGDFWFGIGALSQLKPKLTGHGEGRHHEGKKRRDSGSDGGDSVSGFSVNSETDGKQHTEEVLKKIYELEIERRIGQQTVTEAINAVSELKWQQVKEKTDKSKLSQKILGLRKKLVSRAREHRRLAQEATRQEERLGILTQSRDEYMDLVSNLEAEKKKLKDRLNMLGGNAPLALEDQEMSKEDREAARARERDLALEAMRSPREGDVKDRGRRPSNDYANGHSNGHDNGHSNGHGNGRSNGHSGERNGNGKRSDHPRGSPNNSDTDRNGRGRDQSRDRKR